jgi:hypothetical protein
MNTITELWAFVASLGDLARASPLSSVWYTDPRIDQRLTQIAATTTIASESLRLIPARQR